MNAFWKKNWWKIAIFAAGPLIVQGIGRHYFPFPLRFFLWVSWGVIMAFIFIKHLDSMD